VGTVEDLFVLDRGEVVVGGVQPPVVVAVDPFQGGQLDVADVLGLADPAWRRTSAHGRAANTATNIARLTGHANIAAAQRTAARSPTAITEALHAA